MVRLLADNFLPDVEACDEQGFTDCLLASDDGFDLSRYDFNADIFEHDCAPTYGCQTAKDLDRAAWNEAGNQFGGNMTALGDSINELDR